jgi:hypothetical protein
MSSDHNQLTRGRTDMRLWKTIGALCAVVLCVAGAGNAYAAQFTASSVGTTAGHAISAQVFTFAAGTVSCSVAAAKGPINSVASTERTVVVTYSGCTAFGVSGADVGKAEYRYTAGGALDVLNNVSITPTFLGASMCTVTVGPQSKTAVGYSNAGSSNVEATHNVTGLGYTASGGLCGASGTTGTLAGTEEFNREGGGTVRFDP